MVKGADSFVIKPLESIANFRAKGVEYINMEEIRVAKRLET